MHLKDVNELLQLPVLGEEGYSIYSTGQIDQILSSEARRPA